MKELCMEQHLMLLLKKEDEIRLLTSGKNVERIRNYALYVGFRSLEAQRLLLKTHMLDIIHIQHMCHFEMWHSKLYNELVELGFYKSSSAEEDERKYRDALMAQLQLSTNLYSSDVRCSRFTEAVKAGFCKLKKTKSPTTGEIQFFGTKWEPEKLTPQQQYKCCWQKKWEKIYRMGQRLYPNCEELFFAKAPEQYLFWYLKFFKPRTIRGEKNLMRRAKPLVAQYILISHRDD